MYQVILLLLLLALPANASPHYYRDAQGNYLGGYDGAAPPAGAIEVPKAPEHALDKWDGSQWVKHAPTAQEEIDAKLQEADKLSDEQFIKVYRINQIKDEAKKEAEWEAVKGGLP